MERSTIALIEKVTPSRRTITSQTEGIMLENPDEG
jgi:hypothetical protein